MIYKTPVVIINYGLGNVASILNMIRFIGGNAKVSSSSDDIRESTKIILPGVGAFDAGMMALLNTDIESAIRDAILKNDAKILGICLGMQLLMESSEEGNLSGLSLIPGRVKRFQIRDLGLRVPHMGWNDVCPVRSSVLFDLNSKEQRFYFVHSYHVECDDPNDIVGTTKYGYSFPSAIEHGNVLGVQFHPEKSHRYGKVLLQRFLEW